MFILSLIIIDIILALVIIASENKRRNSDVELQTAERMFLREKKKFESLREAYDKAINK